MLPLRSQDDWPLHIIPLGGLGEIGMNSMLFRQGDDALMVDCGVQFPESMRVGVEHILPNLDTLMAARDKIRGIVITHGHEDHIGALPWVWPRLKVPLYATAFTERLIRRKFSEGYSEVLEDGGEDGPPITIVEPGDEIRIGSFDVRFLRVTHSIPDCVSVVLGTAAGTVIHTGDFKIERGPLDGRELDEAGFKAEGDSGVRLLLSDSTNALVAGRNPREAEVADGLAELIGSWPGRVIVSMFSSNLYRLSTLHRLATKSGRRLCIGGRSMYAYLRAGCATIPLELPDPDQVLDVEDAAGLPDHQVLIACTGSQAESRAVLARAARGDHPRLTIGAGDLVVFSSRKIPGNERPIFRLINDLTRLGARCVLDRYDTCYHTSGHARQDELTEMLRLVRPAHFVPVHGEYTFLRAHAELGRAAGVETTVVENGQVLGVSSDDVAIIGAVDATPFFSDGGSVGSADDLRMREKVRLAWHGVVSADVRVDERGGSRRVRVELDSAGIFTDEGALLDDAEEFVEAELTDLGPGLDDDAFSEAARIRVRRFFKKRVEKKPTVFVVLHRRR